MLLPLLPLHLPPLRILFLFFHFIVRPLALSLLSSSLFPISASPLWNIEDLAASGRESMASDSVEASVDKKYGEIAPKKKPLISQGNGRAFFDSADWVLCQGENRGAAVETLRPKLQPTPHQRLPPRKPVCRSVKDDKVMKDK